MQLFNNNLIFNEHLENFPEIIVPNNIIISPVLTFHSFFSIFTDKLLTNGPFDSYKNNQTMTIDQEIVLKDNHKSSDKYYLFLNRKQIIEFEF